MLIAPHGMIGRFLHRRSLARWKAAMREINDQDLDTLERQSDQARRTIRDAQRFRRAAEDRLALPRLGENTFPQPSGTDWSWRPLAWRSKIETRGLAPAMPKDSLTQEVVIFHDCKAAEITMQQFKNIRDIDLSAYRLCLDVFHFEGSYLSLVIEIPQQSCEGLTKNHLLRLSAVIDRERPTEIYARLNIKHGPNTEQVLLTLPDSGHDSYVDFDLAYSQLNEERAERMWLDLMIAKPAMNKITIHDLTFCRHPRAAL